MIIRKEIMRTIDTSLYFNTIIFIKLIEYILNEKIVFVKLFVIKFLFKEVTYSLKDLTKSR
jgi:hypothetical protein